MVDSPASEAHGEDAEVARAGRQRRGLAHALDAGAGRDRHDERRLARSDDLGARPAVDVLLPGRVVPRVKVGLGDGDLQQTDVGGKAVVDRVAHHVRRTRRREVEVDDLAFGVDAGVGTAGPFHAHARASEAGEGVGQDGLHRARRVLLHLPAVKVGADVRDRRAVADGLAHAAASATSPRRPRAPPGPQEQKRERSVLEQQDAPCGQPGHGIEQPVGQRRGEAEKEKPGFAGARGEGQDPEQIPGLERRRGQKRGGQRREDRRFRVSDTPRDRHERQDQRDRQGGAREELRIEIGEERLHPARMMQMLLEPLEDALGAPGYREVVQHARQRRIRERVELPAGRVVAEAADRSDGAARPGDPDRRSDGQPRRRQPQPSAPQQRERGKRRHVLGQHRQREPDPRPDGSAPLQKDQARQQKGDAQRIDVPLPRALEDRERMERVQRGREPRARAAQGGQQGDDREIRQREETLEGEAVPAQRAPGAEGGLSHGGIHRPDVGVGNARAQGGSHVGHGRIRRHVRVGRDSRGGDARVPEIPVQIVGKIGRAEHQGRPKEPAAEQHERERRSG